MNDKSIAKAWATRPTYALTKGLSYPLKSSVFRGILSGTESLAEYVAIVPLDYEELKAYVHEMQSLGAGGCQ